jgi:hypothetical protein
MTLKRRLIRAALVRMLDRVEDLISGNSQALLSRLMITAADFVRQPPMESENNCRISDGPIKQVGRKHTP